MSTALQEVGRLLPVVGFLAAVLVLAKLSDDEGLFHAAGVYMARHSWGAGQSAARRLLTTVFLIAAGTTAVLSLDATVVLLTPVVLSTARTLGVPARPHGYAAAHLANSASLLLPVSNLTNLLAFSAAGLSFTRFTAAMTLPWLFAVPAEYAVLRWLFRRELRVGTSDRDAPPPPEIPYFVLTVLVLTLIGFGVTSLLGLAPAWAAFAGAAVLAIRAVVRGHETPLGIVRAANVPFLIAVLALGVLVSVVLDLGLGRWLSQLLPHGTTLPALLAIAAVAAVLSNLINNLPAVLVLLPLVAAGGPVAVLAVLIGVNIGPNLTYPGSLSNLLWRNVVRGQMSASAREFTVIGLATVPVTLVLAVSGLWLGCSVLGMN
ncbi:arsenic transporter [Mycobacterium sp. ST-F2]|uniref:SLC13 family permease n=1 Tax=Mycobacterium sp. ST-F2 TaxID=1490484 RepID=UPI000962A94A|nr:SLC13 family permease [Mycobacterium sp. ST-F2]OKH85117.1 arsenic transporter [Mycobacterium sp. ST-F2]